MCSGSGWKSKFLAELTVRGISKIDPEFIGFRPKNGRFLKPADEVQVSNYVNAIIAVASRVLLFLGRGKGRHVNVLTRKED